MSEASVTSRPLPKSQLFTHQMVSFPRGAETSRAQTSTVRRSPSVKTWIRPCLAEFVQVMIFTFIGTMSVANIGPHVTGIAVAHGLTIALLIAGFGGISGGHINPAVTLGVTLGGGIKPLLAVFYVISQLLGGIVGAALCRGVLGDDAYALINGGGHTLGAGVGVGQGVLCEIVLTLVLVQSVLLTAVDTDKNTAAPFAIGLSVLVDILAAGNISGGSMNPARSFGPAVVVSNLKSIWKHHWVYWVGPIVGACIAALDYRLLFGRDDKRVLQVCCPAEDRNAEDPERIMR